MKAVLHPHAQEARGAAAPAMGQKLDGALASRQAGALEGRELPNARADEKQSAQDAAGAGHPHGEQPAPVQAPMNGGGG